MDFFYWKSPRFGKSLETFGSRTFFCRFLKSLRWYGFSYRFLVVLNLVHQYFVLKTLFYQRPPLEAYLYHRMVSCAPKKSTG